MSTAAELLGGLEARGFLVVAVGTRLDVSPAGALTDEDRAAIRAHKPALLELVAQRQHVRAAHAAATPIAAELVAALPQAPCHGGCGKSTPYGWECLACRTSTGESA